MVDSGTLRELDQEAERVAGRVGQDVERFVAVL